MIAEVQPQPPYPSCHVCGAEMVPDGYKCLSCGANTKPTEGVQPSAPSAERFFADLPREDEIGEELAYSFDEQEREVIFKFAEAYAASRTAELEASVDTLKRALRSRRAKMVKLFEAYRELERQLASRSADLEKHIDELDEEIGERDMAIYGSDGWKERLETAERQLAEARQALDWIMKVFKRHLAGTPVRDVDEAISRAERVLGPDGLSRVPTE